MNAIIRLELINGILTVRHGQTNEILFSREATETDWIKIWDSIRGNQIDYTDFIEINN